MSEENIDWTSFTRRILINKSPNEVFQWWSNARNIETWFLKSCNFFDELGQVKSQDTAIATGDKYEWEWHGWSGHIEKGSVLSVTANEQIQFTFGAAGVVTIQFSTSGENTLLEITQSDIPNSESSKFNYFYGCSLGWSFWLVNLKAYLEHGILLDERSSKYDGDMTIVNQ